MHLISAQGIRKTYPLDKTISVALDSVSIDIAAGERVCLMGPSGSGKSTLLNLIGCIDRASEGSLIIAGIDTDRMRDDALSEFRNRTMGFIFQSFNLIPVLSVFENVEYPLLLQGVKAAERRRRVMALLEAVGLGAFHKRGPEKLSGGQRQRVAIARALVTGPSLVIADEPTAALDHKTGTDIMELLVRLNEESGTTLVFSTHDETVARHAKRLVRMMDGVIVEDRREA